MSRRTAQRYARALGLAVADESQLELAGDQLRELQGILAEHGDLRIVLMNHALGVRRRDLVLNEVTRALGYLPEVCRLSKTLLERNRLNELELVVEEFDDIVDARLNRIAARVTTAHDMTPEHESQLQHSLNAYTGKEVKLRKRVDSRIIGGVRVDMRGKIIDGTLRTRLRRLREYLLAEETASE